MVYYETSLLARDPDFQSRIAACYGTETMEQDPESWASLHQWMISSSPGFGEAYAYALNTGNPNPGRDPAVITDGMILSAVQAIITTETPPAGMTDEDTMIIIDPEDDHA